VQKLADFLKQYPKHVVLVEGHTDSTGSDSLNQELSDRRASAVRTALIDKGSAATVSLRAAMARHIRSPTTTPLQAVN